MNDTEKAKSNSKLYQFIVQPQGSTVFVMNITANNSDDAQKELKNVMQSKTFNATLNIEANIFDKMEFVKALGVEILQFTGDPLPPPLEIACEDKIQVSENQMIALLKDRGYSIAKNKKLTAEKV